MKRLSMPLAIALTLATVARSETVVDFEELDSFNGTPPAGSGEYFNGYGAGANSDGWTSKGVTFQTNEFGPGFSYSNVQNTATPGFTNQFAAHPGGGSNGLGGAAIGESYALVNTGSSTLLDGTPTNGAVMTFEAAAELVSIDIANTTYAAQYIQNGLDGFGDPDFDPLAQFGDGDFLTLRIEGFDGVDGTGGSTGTLDFSLADYGGAGIEDDQFVGGWETVDLSGFGATRSLKLSTTSSQISDFGQFGIFHDVPAYAAVDNLTFATAIPEPSTAMLLVVLGTGAALRRRRR